MVPSRTPTEPPTSVPTPSPTGKQAAGNSQSNSNGDGEVAEDGGTAAILAAVFGALALLLALAALYWWHSHRQLEKHVERESKAGRMSLPGARGSVAPPLTENPLHVEKQDVEAGQTAAGAAGKGGDGGGSERRESAVIESHDTIYRNSVVSGDIESNEMTLNPLAVQNPAQHDQASAVEEARL